METEAPGRRAVTGTAPAPRAIRGGGPREAAVELPAATARPGEGHRGGGPAAARPARRARPAGRRGAGLRPLALASAAVLIAWSASLAWPAGAPREVTADARAEREIVHRTNVIRGNRGLGALGVDEELSRLAREHSCEMARRRFFGHESPSEGGLRDRIRQAEGRFARAAENLAQVSGGDPVALAIRGWLESPGHRTNLLGETFTQTGVGVCRAGDTYYVTQLLGRPLEARAG